MLHFTMLASGSAGNAGLLEADGFGALIDVGLGPRQLAARLAAVGASWKRIHAALLTHTHTDHWNDRTLAHLHKLGIPLYCHAEHHRTLLAYSPAFARLRSANLVRPYELDCDLSLSAALGCRPLRLRHDGGMTCGFRFEGPSDLFGQPSTLAYAADLGCWDAELARALADVDVLALEFNHDVDLERGSGRSPRLIARVLGDDGHLSNVQAAGLVREVLDHSEPGRLQHLVQLHLSRDCNRPALALAAAQEVLVDRRPLVAVHTAHQDTVGPALRVGVSAASPRRARPRRPRTPLPRRTPAFIQRWLPGWED
jgi:ribonuclease BN (tRNA processing enzyme)